MDYQTIKTLKKQVEYILRVYPDTRDSDTELAIRLALFFKREAVAIKDSVARCRRKLNEEGHYITANYEVARQRKMTVDEWRVAMGYQTTNGSFTPPSEARRANSYPSKSKTGVTYLVNETPEGYTCSCPSYAHRRTCQHIKQTLRRVQQNSMNKLI